MKFSLILFLTGILGFVLNRKNIILMLISIEIMLLSITFLILLSSLSFDDILGQTFSVYIIAIAGAESAKCRHRVGSGHTTMSTATTPKAHPHEASPRRNLTTLSRFSTFPKPSDSS